jgi:hypothetical protein
MVSFGGGASATTTFELIRDGYRTAILTLTPRRLSNLKFDFIDDEPLVEMATRVPSVAMFRRCEMTRTGDVAPQSPIIEPNAQERQESAQLVIAYPVLENLAGREKYRELEDIMRDDASQLHDVLFWSGNYQIGQSACYVTIAPPTRVSAQLYLQTFNLRIDYYEAQSLGTGA